MKLDTTEIEFLEIWLGQERVWSVDNWGSTVGMMWQSPSWLSGIIQGSLRVTEPLMSSRNSHVVVSHEDGAIGVRSLYMVMRGEGGRKGVLK